MFLTASLMVLSEAMFLFMAVVQMPVPIFFVIIMASPSLAVQFFHIRSG